MVAFKLNSVVAMALLLLLASMQFHGTAAQTTHVVGDALGWTIPSAGASAYTTWASRQTFTVGDVLLFNFTTGLHTVAEVAQAAYGPCTTGNPISVAATGPARLMLNAAGTHYYICTVGSHCQLGQKLTINVSAAASATPAPAPAPATPAPVSPPTTTPAPTPAPSTTVSPPTSSPAPSTTVSPPTSSPAPSASEASPPSPPASGGSPAGSTTPSPTGSTTGPPPPNSGALSLTAVLPVTFLAMTLAFFF